MNYFELRNFLFTSFCCRYCDCDITGNEYMPFSLFVSSISEECSLTKHNCKFRPEINKVDELGTCDENYYIFIRNLDLEQY